MASCGSCSRQVCDVPIPRNPNAKYTEGDVCGLKESVYTPIYDILRKSFPKYGAGSGAFKRSRRSFLDITSVPDVISHARPAVIVDDEGYDGQGLMVYLATKYEGKDISTLPRIFQHFSIPIAPHNHISPSHLDHVHSLPEWGTENAWIIGRQFRSKATRKGPWIAHIDGERVPYAFGRDAMMFLETECEKRWDDWNDMCKDPVLAAQLEADLRDHVNKRSCHPYGGAGSRASSRESVATVNGGSRPSRVRNPTTIPEEPGNDVVPGAPGKPREPRPHKFTGKPRTGSTYSFTSASGKMSDADKNSIKSTRSRTSLAQKPQSGSGFLNKFDVLRTLKVNAG